MAEELEILTLEGAAAYLRAHPSTIYRLLKRKELPGFKVAADWRFKKSGLDRWRLEAERRRT